LLKAQVDRIKKELLEKDFYLLQMKKSYDLGKDKKFLMLKYEDIEKANDLL